MAMLFPNPQKEENEREEKERKKAIREEMLIAKHANQEFKKLRRNKNAEKNKKKMAAAAALSPKAVLRARQRQQALAMRMRHMSYAEIGDRLKISWQTARTLVREGVEEIPEESQREVKKVLAYTINKFLKSFSEMALDKVDPKTAEIALKSVDRLMKLSGLDIRREEVETTSLGNSLDEKQIDLSELDLDLETKKKVLEALRKKKKEKEILEGITEMNEEENEEKQ